MQGQGIVQLIFERLGLFPGKALVGKVTVLCGLAVNGSCKIKLLDDDTRSEIKVVSNDLHKLIR